MAFDFPTSPTNGQVSNGYTWNGTLWAGGPGIASAPGEQFIDLGGRGSVDIDVPDWAKFAEISGSVWPLATTSYLMMQWSTDGTTFYAGTSYQLMGGITHAITGGYVTQAAGAAPAIYVTYPRTNLNVPHTFACAFNLEAAVGNQLFAARSEMQAFDNAAGGSQFIWSGYLNVVVVPGRIKKIRLLGYPLPSPIFPVNSVVKIKWSGIAVPTSNAIPEAPQDGGEYVRVNGVWRLNKQDFDWTANLIDIPVPAWGPKTCTASFFVGKSGAAVVTPYMRMSVDGTTFAAGATDYYTAGVLGQGTTAQYQVIAADTGMFLTFSHDNTSVGMQGTFDIELVRSANSSFQYRGYSSSYNNNAAILNRTAVLNGYASGAWSAAPAVVKALRFFLSPSGVPTAGSRISVEWK